MIYCRVAVGGCDMRIRVICTSNRCFTADVPNSVSMVFSINMTMGPTLKMSRIQPGGELRNHDTGGGTCHQSICKVRPPPNLLLTFPAPHNWATELPIWSSLSPRVQVNYIWCRTGNYRPCPPVALMKWPAKSPNLLSRQWDLQMGSPFLSGMA